MLSTILTVLCLAALFAWLTHVGWDRWSTGGGSWRRARAAGPYMGGALLSLLGIGWVSRPLVQMARERAHEGHGLLWLVAGGGVILTAYGVLGAARRRIRIRGPVIEGPAAVGRGILLAIVSAVGTVLLFALLFR